MNNTLLIFQIIISFLLLIAILVQVKGTGLGRVWGSSWNSSFSKRGVEQFIFRATFVLVALFMFISGLALVM